MPHRLYDYCVLPISSFESLMVLQNYILPEEIVKAEASVEVKTPLQEGSFRKKAAEPLYISVFCGAILPSDSMFFQFSQQFWILQM